MSSPREIKTGELLRALIVVGPFVAAYFASRDTALLDLGRYALPVLAATLTLISFSRYNVGFGLRCFFIALAASFAGGASSIAEERVANVIIAGAFGLIALELTEIVWLRLRKATRPLQLS